jgi:hypothetical protein
MSAPGRVLTTAETDADRDREPCCAEAQADGVPCETVEGACADCARASGEPSAAATGRGEG